METPQPGRHDVQTRALQALGWPPRVHSRGGATVPAAHCRDRIRPPRPPRAQRRRDILRRMRRAGNRNRRDPDFRLPRQQGAAHLPAVPDHSAGGSPYDTFTLKAAALTTVAIIAVLVGWIAFRLAGAAAAVVAPALLLQPLVSDSTTCAQDRNGRRSLSAGRLVLLTGAHPGVAAGCSLPRPAPRLAALTKQTYAVAGMAVILWVAVSTEAGASPGSRPPRQGIRLLHGSAASVPGFPGNFLHTEAAHRLPGECFPLSFHLRWRQRGHSMFGELIWRAGPSWTTFPLAVPVQPVRRRHGIELHARLAGCPRAAPCPKRTPAHPACRPVPARDADGAAEVLCLPCIPAWVPMAILGSLVIGDYWPRLYRSAPGGAAAVSMGLLAAALLPAASSWLSNGGRDNIADLRAPRSVLQGSRGEFGYVLGTWPHFYFYNGLIPATAVQFPWALPARRATGIPPCRIRPACAGACWHACRNATCRSCWPISKTRPRATFLSWRKWPAGPARPG